MIRIFSRDGNTVLKEVDAEALSNANLSNADLSNADLCNADLRNANLSNADLSNADLRYTNLRWAIGICDAGVDRRGFRFVGIYHDDGWRVAAGCRWFTIPEAIAHWTASGNKDALARVAVIQAAAERE